MSFLPYAAGAVVGGALLGAGLVVGLTVWRHGEKVAWSALSVLVLSAALVLAGG